MSGVGAAKCPANFHLATTTIPFPPHLALPHILPAHPSIYQPSLFVPLCALLEPSPSYFTIPTTRLSFKFCITSPEIAQPVATFQPSVRNCHLRHFPRSRILSRPVLFLERENRRTVELSCVSATASELLSHLVFISFPNTDFQLPPRDLRDHLNTEI